MAEKPKKKLQVEPAADKKTALAKALEQIEKQFGEGAVMKMGDNRHLNIDVIPTGSLALDLALGIGGLPRGRVIEIYGPESSGKTTVALHVAAEAQKMGGTVAYIDAEHALDPVYAEGIGVDVDSLLVSQPDYGEQALEIAEQLVRSGAIDLIVIDSVAALVPKTEVEGEMGDAHVGLQARMMSQALRKLTSVLARSNCVAIFINQLRDKVGVFYGSSETTTGGRALKFYASVRLDIRKVESLKAGTDIIGNAVKCKVVKNKVAPPFRQANFDIMFGTGISREGELLDLGEKLKVVKKSGAWFSYNGDRIGQGRDNAKKFLKENPDVAKELDAYIRAHFDDLAALEAKSAKAAPKKGAEESAEAAPEQEVNPPVSLDVSADDFE